MFKPKKLILTAGPSISGREIKYVMDAAKNGWNEKAGNYLHELEREFSKYVGTKYAIGTSGGTGSLHLALATLGIGPGDEVILPEITYFACSDVVSLLGAKPVFVDVLPDTWCMDPDKIKGAITKRTRAIMPVHIYGNLCEMNEIMQIAHRFNLHIVEDACPALGSKYHGRSPGSFGDFGAFSFQGAKIAVAGIGGMLVTNSGELFEKAKYLNNHGEDRRRKFWQTSVGYSFEMSNLQAAFGLAQLSRIDQFVSAKRRIYSWYKKTLGKLDGISMNFEREGTSSNMWMSSIVLKKKFSIERDKLIKELRKKLIDSRPFFYPISMFGMYKEQNTPVAHHVGLNGINLPSGLKRTREEIEYIANTLLRLLS